MHILMIKKVLGHPLKYLCKSSSTKIESDPTYVYTYKGSGKRWVNHLKAHLGIVVTCVIGVYNTMAELREAGVFYSNQFDVVASDEWANLTEEQGDGGFIGQGQLGKRWKMSDEAREVVKRAYHRRISNESVEQKNARYEKTRGSANYQCTSLIKTPWGDFSSLKAACAAAKVIKKSGRRDVITDTGCLRARLNNLDEKFETPRIAFEGWRNKSAREVGFDVIPLGDSR